MRCIPWACWIFGAMALMGQSKQAPAPADYGQFEMLGQPAPYGGLSPDGKWLVYAVTRSNRDNELRIAKVADGSTKAVAFGGQPVYSADSRWLAYGIGYSEAQEEKLKKDKKRSEKKLGLMNLATGEQSVVDGIEALAFSADGAYLAVRRYAPEKKDAPAPNPEADEPPAAATLIVRQMGSGKDTAFGNVSEFAWQDLPKRGHLLALAISAEDKTGNGVQLFDAETGSLRVLDSSAAVYTGLAWRKDSADLAVLRSKNDDAREGASQTALAWQKLGDSTEMKRVYDPAKDATFPAAMRVVAYRKPAWAEDGGTVYLGFAKWEKKIPAGKSKDEEEAASVDIWHWRDLEVMPHQKLSARMNRQRNLLAAWHVESGKVVPLGQTLTEQVTPLKHGNVAYAANWTGFAMERSIGRPAAEISLVDTDTGQRTELREKLSYDRYLQASPGGKYLLYFEGDHYWTVNVATRALVNITKAVKAEFADRESDFTEAQKPPFGVAGWTKNDEAVILYDKFDLWKVAPDGSKAARLTDGTAEQVRHRYVRLNPQEEWMDTSKPVYVSLFGIWTKKSGYARLKEDGGDEHLLWMEKSVSRLAKAKDADIYEYVAEKFDESPNAFVGPDLVSAKRVTDTNPFRSNYAWGHEELIEYKNSQGERLQGTLYYPAGFEEGRKYPMVVYMYEKLSDGMHRFAAPSERDYYSAGAITSHGYFLLEPDIVFRPHEPGLSVADCVSAAVKKALESGHIDGKKIGIVGHSWGGFDSAFLATHTKLFAAAVAGAPITDLVSNYGNHHWSSGIAETDHIETGQQRMQVPIYEDLQAYIRNSAVFNVQNMTTPLMIEVGDSDGTVFFHQGVELYNIARRAGKNVVLLVYGGEDHGLRKKADQIDYQQKIFAWFGHYLKDEPAPGWITDGKSYLERQRELSELKGAGKNAGKSEDK